MRSSLKALIVLAASLAALASAPAWGVAARLSTIWAGSLLRKISRRFQNHLLQDARRAEKSFNIPASLIFSIRLRPTMTCGN